MKLEELRRRVNLWLKNPAAAENSWFKDANSLWGNLLISAVHFLSGEFADQPEGFVPYLEFKSHLNIYQWIGAGRDGDHRMVNLNQYWLSRQKDMGVRNKTKLKIVSTPESNEENYLINSVPQARCRSDWKVRVANKDEINNYQMQEKRRFELPYKSFTYREHDYESVVGPVRNLHLAQTAIAKTRDNNVLKSERPNFITTTALVRDAIARLPNGEGTRAEIGELLKSSQYVLPHIFDTALQSIVESALNILCGESEDPCVKFDSKRKVWIYIHRNRSMEDFDRIHQQQLIAKKRIVGKKPENHEENERKVVKFDNLKSLPSTSDNRQKIRIQSSPPPLKITTPSRIIKQIQNPERNLEAFDAEASLDAIVTSDPKTSRITLKNVQQIPSIVRAQSPKVTTIIGQKKMIGKPIMINQSQGSPTVSISGQSFSINSTPSPSTSKIVTTPTQGKNIIKLQNTNVRVTKSVGSPQQVQQKIILTAAGSTPNKTGKIITFPRNSTPMLSQQKQILTNVIVQQQKAKSGQNQILLTANNQQKMPSLTISSPGTAAGSSGTPQQRQAILQLKQIKESVPTVVLKQQTLKSDQTTLVGVNKLIKTPINSQQVQQGTSIQKTTPEVSTARIITNVSGVHGTTFKLAQIGSSQGNIIQMTSVPQSSIATTLTKFTTTQASTTTPIVSTSTSQNILITNSQSTSSAPTIKLQSGGSITAQQLMNAKFINVQTLNNKGIKTAGGIK
jgi:nuclear factor related to kappa-B-binding protein